MAWVLHSHNLLHNLPHSQVFTALKILNLQELSSLSLFCSIEGNENIMMFNRRAYSSRAYTKNIQESKTLKELIAIP